MFIPKLNTLILILSSSQAENPSNYFCLQKHDMGTQ